MGYHLRLFGATEVEHNGVPVRGFVSRKALALLGYLATQQRPVARSYLAYLLWQDKPEARGRGNLSRVVNNLSELLPDCLIADYHSLQINPKTLAWLDTQRFSALLGQADLEAKQQAVELYRVDLMADLRLRDSPEFDHWLAGEQERWRREVIQLLQQLVFHYRQAEDYEQAIPLAHRLVAIAPWLEETHQELMLMLARCGQRGAALAQYESCRRALADELGVDPAAETVQVYQRIRAMEAEPRIELPGQPTLFVGREAELSSVGQLLLDPTCRLLTLTGPGGMGKTRLAIEAACRVAAFKYLAFLNGIFFVPLASVQTPDSLAPTVAQALRISLYGAADPAQRLLSQLRDQELLLILDNFEHLLDGAGFVAAMLEQAPAIKLLVTSRARLNLRWEWSFPLEGLDIPDAPPISAQDQRNGTAKPLSLEPARAASDLSRSGRSASQFSALKLFGQVARRVQPGFAVAPETLPDIIQICRLVGGLPLGIELAATRLQDQSCSEVAWGIARSLGYLRSSYHDLPERHRSLQAVFDYSWGFLSAAKQTVFKQLAVFEGGFTQEAAAQVAGATAGSLTALVNHSLLRQDKSGRYDLHELIRQYGLEKLKSDPAAAEKAENKHSNYYLDYIQQRSPERATHQIVALNEIEVEIANIRQAWGQAVKHLKAKALQQMAPVLFNFLELRGDFKEAYDLFGQTAASIASPLSRSDSSEHSGRRDAPRVYGEMVMWQSWFAMRLGRFKKARELLNEASPIFDALINSDCWYKAFPLYLQGLINWHLGNYQAAEQHLEHALSISSRENALILKSVTLSHLGLTAFAIGDFHKARLKHQESLQVAGKIFEQSIFGQQHICLGWVANAVGDYGEARGLIDEGLKICKEVQHLFSIALGLSFRGLVSWRQGEPLPGKEYCLEGLKIFSQIEDRFGQSLALDHLGQITWATGDYNQSKQYFLDALRISTDSGLPPRMLAALVGLAKHLQREDNALKALALATFVAHHPASEHMVKEEAQQLIAELRAQLGPVVVAEAQQNGVQEDLEAIARNLLA